MYCRSCGEYLNDDQVVCLKCGVPKGVGSNYCYSCGKETSPDAVICTNCGASLKQNPVHNADMEAASRIEKRDLVKAILLSILTCGIYSIYWFIVLTNDINEISGDRSAPSGGVAFLLSLVTCGIYSYYWAYKIGEKVDYITDNKNGSSGILYLVLSLLGVGIVVYALAQDAVNKTIDRANQ